jgi:hypothetical protein
VRDRREHLSDLSGRHVLGRGVQRLLVGQLRDRVLQRLELRDAHDRPSLRDERRRVHAM